MTGKLENGQTQKGNQGDDDDDDNTDLKLGWTVKWRTATGNKSCLIWGYN